MPLQEPESVGSHKHIAPRVSVVVIAKNEEKTIGKCVSSILQQDYPNFQVIFVDGGSRDDTPNIVRSLSGLSRSIVVLNDPSGTSASGRNMGLSAADGDIIAFADGDCYFEQDWLSRAVEHLTDAGDLNLAGVGGPNVQLSRATSQASSVFSSIQSTVLGSGGSVEVHVYGAPRIVKSLSFRGAVFWAEVIRRVGSFDGRLQYCEDSELCHRLRSAGYRLLYANDIRAYHTVKYSSIEGFARKMYYYGLGRGRAIRLHRTLFTWFALAALAYSATFLALGVLSLSPGLPHYRLAAFLLGMFYLFLIMVFSVFVGLRQRQVRAFGLALVSYMALHVSYTAGLVVGLVAPVGRK